MQCLFLCFSELDWPDISCLLQALNFGSIPPGTVANSSEVLIHMEEKATPPPVNDILQVAIKTNQIGVMYFQDTVTLESLFVEDGMIDQNIFLAAWKTLAGENDANEVIGVAIPDVDQMIKNLQSKNIFLMAHRPVCGAKSLVLWEPFTFILFSFLVLNHAYRSYFRYRIPTKRLST